MKLLRMLNKESQTVRTLSISLLVIGCGLCADYVLADDSPRKWEQQIARFEAADREQEPPKQAILFVGSSSIRLWKLDKYFPEYKTINRGFGGSQMSDSVYYFDRIVAPHKPKTIVVYAGDNDIAAGESAEEVAKDFREFVQLVKQDLPKTRVYYIAIKPSLKRWHLVDEMRKANRMIREFTARDPNLGFIDIDTPMIGNDGKPRKELFAKDGLHLNDNGYELWTKLVKEVLSAPTGTTKERVTK